MSKHNKRRLNPIAAANARRKKSIWSDPRSYGIFAIGTMIGVGVIPAVAESTGNAFASPDETLVTTETTSINAASEAGQQAALENAFGTGGGQASGATAGSNNSTSDSATSSVSGDVMEAAIVCADPNNPDGLRSHFDKVLQDQQELAIVQVDTDSIFNADPEAAAMKPSRAALQRVIKLLTWHNQSRQLPQAGAILATWCKPLSIKSCKKSKQTC